MGQHHAAAQERGGQFALFVGGDDHQRPSGTALARRYFTWNGGNFKTPGTQHFQQTVGHVAGGFVDFVYQHHMAGFGLRFCAIGPRQTAVVVGAVPVERFPQRLRLPIAVGIRV